LTQTDKELGILNGAFGHIKSLSQDHCQVELGGGKDVEFNPQTYHGLKLGYASTVYKSQGKTLDQVYVLHGSATNNRTNYVALSRQEESLQVFVNRQETHNERHLVHQMSKDQEKSLSIRYLTEEQANRARTLGDGYWDAAKEVWIDLKTNVRNRLSDLFHENKEFYDFKGREDSKGPQQVVEVDASALRGQGLVIPEEQHEKHTWSPLFPIPENAPKPNIENNPNLSSMAADRQITDMHAYRARQGELLGYVVRLEDQAGDNITSTLTYCENEKGEQQWQWQDFGEGRPLYGQEKLVKHPTKPVLVIEGEKVADSAQKLFPDHVVMSWPGGAEEVEKADWGPLLGRNVSIWPNQAEAGLKAAQHIESALQGINGKYGLRADIAIVDLPKDLPVNWDLTNTLPSTLSIKDLHNLVHKEHKEQDQHRTFNPQIPHLQQIHDLRVHDYLRDNHHHKTIPQKPAHEVEAMKFSERFHAYQLDSYKNQITKEDKAQFEKEVTTFMKNERAVNYLKSIDADMVKSLERIHRDVEMTHTRDFGLER
jgi:hypothetical protein